MKKRLLLCLLLPLPLFAERKVSGSVEGLFYIEKWGKTQKVFPVYGIISADLLELDFGTNTTGTYTVVFNAQERKNLLDAIERYKVLAQEAGKKITLDRDITNFRYTSLKENGDTPKEAGKPSLNVTAFSQNKRTHQLVLTFFETNSITPPQIYFSIDQTEDLANWLSEEGFKRLSLSPPITKDKASF